MHPFHEVPLRYRHDSRVAPWAAMVLLALVGAAAGDEPASARPHILIIHVDQHRADCIGAYGNSDVKTPQIDQIARDGVLYQNSFCPYPVCTPSRYSLLSGRFVHDHGGWNNRSTLLPRIATFPKILRAAGYRTAAVGKMHFHPTYLDVGFDHMTLAEQDGPGRWDDDYHRYLMQNGLVDRNDLEDQRAEYRRLAPQSYWDTCGALVSNLPEQHHSTTWIADRALETLAAWESDGPSLLMVGFIKPHHPFDPPSPWQEMYDAERLTLLPGWIDQSLPRDLDFSRGYFPNAELTEAKVRRVMAYYYATISQIDHHVGRMIESLKAKGLYDRTLILYTADHGDYVGFHHMLLKGNYMYDPLVRVPLMIKWPKSARAGTVSQEMVSNIDLAPTLCRAAGCLPAPEMKGRDLHAGPEGERLVFAEHIMGREIMVRSRTRKLILAAPQKENLFFDLERDPLEMNNLVGSPEYRDEIQRLENALIAWRCKDPAPKATLDLAAPQIDQPNVLPPDGRHREVIIKYYKSKMQAE